MTIMRKSIKVILWICGVFFVLAGILLTPRTTESLFTAISPDRELGSLMVAFSVYLQPFLWIMAILSFLTAFLRDYIGRLVGGIVRIATVLTSWRFLGIVLFIALFLRVIWIVIVPSLPVSDTLWFHERAVSIASGDGYSVDGVPTAYRPVGYPAMLAAAYAVFGTVPLVGKVLNILFALGYILLSYFVGRYVVGESAARLGTAILAILPSQIFFSGLLFSEIALTFFFIAATLLLMTEKATYLNLVLAAFSLSVATLIRPMFFPIFIGALLFIALRRRNRIGAGKVLVFVMAFLIPLVPWTVRNVRVFGGFVPISTNGGVNLFIGNNPKGQGAYFFNDGLEIKSPSLNEREMSAEYRSKALRYIVSHPLQTVATVPKKLFFLFIRDTIGVHFSFMRVEKDIPPWFQLTMLALSQMAYLILLLFFGVYLVFFIGKNSSRLSSIGLFPILYFVLFYSVFFGADRFHFPIMPFIAMYAAFGMIETMRGLGFPHNFSLQSPSKAFAK